MTYTNIKSELIKEAIKNTPWKKRQYIEDLIFLENSILHGVRGMGSNIRLHCLSSQYEKEYLKLFKELKPPIYKEVLEITRKEKSETRKINRKIREEEALELKQDKESWKKMGGNLILN